MSSHDKNGSRSGIQMSFNWISWSSVLISSRSRWLRKLEKTAPNSLKAQINTELSEFSQLVSLGQNSAKYHKGGTNCWVLKAKSRWTDSEIWNQGQLSEPTWYFGTFTCRSILPAVLHSMIQGTCYMPFPEFGRSIFPFKIKKPSLILGTRTLSPSSLESALVQRLLDCSKCQFISITSIGTFPGSCWLR